MDRPHVPPSVLARLRSGFAHSGHSTLPLPTVRADVPRAPRAGETACRRCDHPVGAHAGRCRHCGARLIPRAYPCPFCGGRNRVTHEELRRGDPCRDCARALLQGDEIEGRWDD